MACVEGQVPYCTAAASVQEWFLKLQSASLWTLCRLVLGVGWFPQTEVTLSRKTLWWCVQLFLHLITSQLYSCILWMPFKFCTFQSFCFKLNECECLWSVSVPDPFVPEHQSFPRGTSICCVQGWMFSSTKHSVMFAGLQISLRSARWIMLLNNTHLMQITRKYTMEKQFSNRERF